MTAPLSARSEGQSDSETSLARSNYITDELRVCLEKMTDTQVVALVLYGEARSEPIEGIVAVASVIRNRSKNPSRFGEGYRGVCLRPYQFSALNEIGGKKNFKYVLALAEQFAAKAKIEDQKTLQCIGVTECVMRGYFADNTNGADHYHTQKLQPRPKWAYGAVIAAHRGSHVFYKQVA